MAATLNGFGRYDDALAQARYALEIEPSDLVALCACASAQLSRHNFVACLAFCETALRSHPDHPQILYNQGGAFAGLGRDQEALAAYTRAAAGLNGLIVPDLETYAATAVALATERDADLHRFRQSIALARSTAPLFDSVTYTRHLERGFHAAYDRYIRGVAPDHIVIARD